MYYFLGELLMNNPLFSKEDKIIAGRNTYLLALDGDVDFKPEAVLLLVDMMKKNERVGAACGRIHPIGSGLSKVKGYINMYSCLLIIILYHPISLQ